MITVCDAKRNEIHWLDYTPNTTSGFMYFRGELREIRDIHYTKLGTQIELY